MPLIQPRCRAKFPNEGCLHCRDSLNKVATPPPLLCALASLITLKLGGVDSIRTEARLFWFNQVSVKNIKLRLCSIIKSLIKNIFPAKDLILSKDSFNVLGSLSASFFNNRLWLFVEPLILFGLFSLLWSSLGPVQICR